MRRLIPTLSAAVMATAMAWPSFAADEHQGYYGPAPGPLTLVSWRGFYAGINGGYSWGQSDWSSSVTAGSSNPGGGLLGATIGFNGQSGGFVFGLEGDIDATWIRDTNSSGTGVCSVACETQNSWLATIRGRLGYAFDRALLYATAGGALGDVQMSTGGLAATVDRAGWTAGVGVEYSIFGPWSAKLEYLYVDLGSVTCGPATCGINTNVDFTSSIVRFGVNYRF
jgi:outer membrane immunogenic protein